MLETIRHDPERRGLDRSLRLGLGTAVGEDPPEAQGPRRSTDRLHLSRARPEASQPLRSRIRLFWPNVPLGVKRPSRPGSCPIATFAGRQPLSLVGRRLLRAGRLTPDIVDRAKAGRALAGSSMGTKRSAGNK